MQSHQARRFCSGSVAIFAWTLIATTMVSADPSTSRGQISVAQVRTMLDQAATNPIARQTLTAYLAGTGETAGWLVDAAAERGLPPQPCARRLSLDDTTVRQALARSAPNASFPGETAATPLIVRDMLKRAGCRLTD
jgi:hypothetical protein